MKERVVWIDWAKSIGILLVVMGHDDAIDERILGYISTFHMPLFFLCSGFLFSADSSFVHLVRKNLLKLCLPYLFYNLVWAALMIVGGLVCQYAHTDPEWHQRICLHLYPLLTGQATEQFCAPVWFLLSLFWCRLSGYWLIRGNRMQKCLLCIIWSLLVFARSKVDYSMPFSLDTAALGMLWFVLGQLLCRHSFCSQSSAIRWIAPLGLIIGFLIYVVHGGCSYVWCRPNGLIGIVGTFCTLIGLYASFQLFGKYSNSVVLSVSKSTLFVMCMHLALLPIKYAFCPALGFGFSLMADIIIVLVLTYIRMFLYNRLSASTIASVKILRACL